MQNQVVEKFSGFYESWVNQLEDYLTQLLTIDVTNPDSTSEQELQALVSRLTTHHKDYYTAKWTAAQDDVLAFYGPSWFSPHETAYSWITGWKPSTAFRVVESLRRLQRPQRRLAELTEEQVWRLEQLRTKVRMEEEKVERKMERHQVVLAERRMVELARLTSRGGEEPVEGMVEAAVKGLEAGLERVTKAADCVRLKTLKGILDILSPAQSVEFLAEASSVLHIQLRQWDKRKQ